jgi:hypothetical protein
MNFESFFYFPNKHINGLLNFKVYFFSKIISMYHEEDTFLPEKSYDF